MDFIVGENVGIFFEENLNIGKIIVDKVLMVVRVRDVVRKVRELIRKLVLERLVLLGKLVDCLLKDFRECEIYIVEGDLVGGLVK